MMIPKPKVGDQVERVDFSRMLGRVIKIISDEKVLIRWADKPKPEEKKEFIKNLALVER